jgi:uncharacterized protein (TIGR03086 family)
MVDMVAEVTLDLGPAARHLSNLVLGVGDDQLGEATPCGSQTVGDVLDHIGSLVVAFAAAARKELGALTASVPVPDGGRLGSGWRTRIVDDLDRLVTAWTDPAAHEGMTQVGGVTMPGAVAGTVALHEVVLHGWDLARATNQPYRPGEAVLETCLSSLSSMFPPDEPDRRAGIFAAPVEVLPDAKLVDRVVAFSGRDPSWPAG